MPYVLVTRPRRGTPSRREFDGHEKASAALKEAGSSGLRVELFRQDGKKMVLFAVMNMPRPKMEE